MNGGRIKRKNLYFIDQESQSEIFAKLQFIIRVTQGVFWNIEVAADFFEELSTGRVGLCTLQIRFEMEAQNSEPINSLLNV